MQIAQHRVSMNITQEDLAKKLGVARSTVAMWENGSNMPRADKLLKLAGLFGCTVDELLGNDPAEAAG